MSAVLQVGGLHRVTLRRDRSSFPSAHLLGNLLVALLPGYTWFQVGLGGSYWDSRAFRSTAWENRFYAPLARRVE